MPNTGERRAPLNLLEPLQWRAGQEDSRTCPPAKFKELLAGATLLRLARLKDEPVRGGCDLGSVVCFWSLPILSFHQALSSI